MPSPRRSKEQHKEVTYLSAARSLAGACSGDLQELANSARQPWSVVYVYRRSGDVSSLLDMATAAVHARGCGMGFAWSSQPTGLAGRDGRRRGYLTTWLWGRCEFSRTMQKSNIAVRAWGKTPRRHAQRRRWPGDDELVYVSSSRCSHDECRRGCGGTRGRRR